MALYTVRYSALCDMVARVEVEADTPQEAVEKAGKSLELTDFELPSEGPETYVGSEELDAVEDEDGEEVLSFAPVWPPDAIRWAKEIAPGWQGLLQELAQSEGWELVEKDPGAEVVVKAVAGGPFGPGAGGDAAAQAHVRRQAEGSALHRRALEAIEKRELDLVRDQEGPAIGSPTPVLG